MFIERSKFPDISRTVILSFAVLLLFFAGTTRSQLLPYITNVFGEDGTVIYSGDGDDGGDGMLRLLGTFKLFNPDTVPFYLWISFENGGKFRHDTRRADLQTVRLVDLELHYKDARGRPVVKKFPNTRFNSRDRKRFAGSWLGGGRSVKGGARERARARARAVEYEDDAEAEVEAVGERGGGRGNGASEITFWKEDAQGYYEMELWGVLYAPDVRKVSVKGRYMENIKFEIEPAR